MVNCEVEVNAYTLTVKLNEYVTVVIMPMGQVIA